MYTGIKKKEYEKIKEIATNSHWTVYKDFVICDREHHRDMVRLEQKEIDIKHNYDYIFEKAKENILKQIDNFIKTNSQ